MKLFDVSPVTFPAYKQTTVKLRDQLSEFGIDFYALSTALIRANRGVSTEADIELFDNVNEIINRYRPIIEDPLPKEHSEPEIDSAIIATQFRATLETLAIKVKLRS